MKTEDLDEDEKELPRKFVCAYCEDVLDVGRMTLFDAEATAYKVGWDNFGDRWYCEKHCYERYAV